MKTAIIIGAGPAGLTAAYELLARTDIKPIVFEASSDIGGISKTINYKGNYIDIGGHRFFSKSDRVMNWWKTVIPVEGGPDPKSVDAVMLIRSRLSRIFYLRKFFSYPISFSMETIRNLGLARMIRILLSYIRAVLFPIRDERTLEEFMINRFGRELYCTFFKDYTEKVWGTECSTISAEWGAQRIKGLSITRTLVHAIRKGMNKTGGISQKLTETSLIEQFLYPKYGPGQMWQETARYIRSRGGEVHLNSPVENITVAGGCVRAVTVLNRETGERTVHEGDYILSSMPVKDLIGSIQGDTVPQNVREVAGGLLYRDFMTVGLLLTKLSIAPARGRETQAMISDNWIYIQERDVRIGRLQVFNNWSPYLVKDPDTVWIGLEYFCNEGDELWSMGDEEFTEFAIDELTRLAFIDREDVLDSTVIRMPKTYPAYHGAYERFHVIREFTDGIENLFLIGRNGMHRYNNQDHSMLTAMTAVDNIACGSISKENIWEINTEEAYHEKR